ncbi:MAG: tRNA 2-thiouridine(34) synthase MnmA [Notoacmeibacter sp.]
MINHAPNSLGFYKPENQTRVVVAMSGGVDSSVVAGLLARQGYEVIGITLQLYDHGAAVKRAGSCCAGQDIEDAKRVSEMLSIPHYVLDYERRFRDAVINPFMESYIAGETPVPCISCNQTVKFADLLATARDLGADCLATGHYIRSEANGEHRALFRPIDAERDQSYFLFATTQEQLDYIRFPLGNMSKPEVRDLATEMGLVVAAKKDSQDICFVPQGKYTDVIAKLKPQSGIPGRIVHMDGRELGEHPGILHYTIGQRRGLGVAAAEPLYIVALDARTATVIVGPREALATHEVELRDMNWLGDKPLRDLPDEGLALYARVRSTRAPKPATLFYRNGKASVVIEGGEDGVSPGQACVLYSSLDNEARVYGGGFISASLRDTTCETAISNVLERQRQNLGAVKAELISA